MPDKYKVNDDHILCVSNSGTLYRITDNFCSCKGFLYRRKCRHLEYALKNGLLKELKAKSVKFSIMNSPFIRKARLKATVVALENNGIKPTKELVLYLEPKLNPKLNMKQFLKLARSYK